MIALAPAAFAQTAGTAGPRDISLEEAVERALSSSSRLEAGRATMDARSAAEAQAEAGRLPALDLEATYMRMKEQEPTTIPLPDPPQGPGPVTLGESIENSYGVTLSLRQPLFTGGAISSRVEAAERALAASRSTYNWERSGVVLEARTAYWNLVEAEFRVETIEERVRQVEENLENMESRLSNGVVTRNEVLTVEMKLAEARLKLLRARNGRELAATRLVLLTGLDPEQELRPATALPSTRPGGPGNDAPEPASPDLQSLIGTALAGRGDLAELRATLDASEVAERAARSGWFPQLFLAGEYTYARPNQASFPVEDEFESSWRVGVVGRIALGDMPRVYHEGSQREAERTAAAARLEAAEDRVRLGVREAYLSYQSSGRELELARTMVRHAEENLADTRVRVENGVALNEDLLEAQATLLDARLALTAALTGRRIAWDQLMRRTGREL
jgi:outer membrane protein TolC